MDGYNWIGTFSSEINSRGVFVFALMSHQGSVRETKRHNQRSLFRARQQLRTHLSLHSFFVFRFAFLFCCSAMVAGPSAAATTPSPPVDVCKVHCAPQVEALKKCIDAVTQDMKAQATSPEAKNAPLESPMLKCLPTIQSWKDCCEEAKYKHGGEREE